MKYLKMGLLTLFGLLIFLSTGCTPEHENSYDLIQEVDASVKGELKFNFAAPLKGSNEVPEVDSKATGLAKVKISKDESYLSYKITIANIDDVIASHFHLAPEGSNGPVVAFLFSSSPPVENPNGVLIEGIITEEDLINSLTGDFQALIEAIRSGNIYINVHSTAVPSGEIRGQL